MPEIILTTLDDARAFAERNRITCEAEWERQPWLNRWMVYEDYKRRLYGELDRAGYTGQVRSYLRQLADRLHV